MFIMVKRLSAIALCFFAGCLPISAEDLGASQKSAGHNMTNSDAPRPAPPPSQKELREIIALSAKGHWTLLGTNWLITDGELKDLRLPLASSHPSPLSLGFF